MPAEQTEIGGGKSWLSHQTNARVGQVLRQSPKPRRGRHTFPVVRELSCPGPGRSAAFVRFWSWAWGVITLDLQKPVHGSWFMQKVCNEREITLTSIGNEESKALLYPVFYGPSPRIVHFGIKL